MKILCIPDVHGRDFWIEPCSHINEFDKIIFLGDYHDPYLFEVSQDTSRHRLRDNLLPFVLEHQDKVICFTDLEQIDEIINDIPDNDIKYDKKKQLLNLANTTSLSGEEGVDKNILNYKKYHKVNINHKKNKEPIIKIMSKESQNHINNKINEAKNTMIELMHWKKN